MKFQALRFSSGDRIKFVASLSIKDLKEISQVVSVEMTSENPRSPVLKISESDICTFTNNSENFEHFGIVDIKLTSKMEFISHYDIEYLSDEDTVPLTVLTVRDEDIIPF